MSSPTSRRRSGGTFIKAAGRKAARLRWWYKARLVRTWPRSDFGAALRFILWDPDINTFTYDLANSDEVSSLVASATGTDPMAAASYAQELHEDAELRAQLSRRTRLRPESKRVPPIGRHLATYVAIRCIKPKLVVECGVKHGLGSLAILRALAANGIEGSPGRLVSIDPDPEAGWLVDSAQHGNWRLVPLPSELALPNCLDGERVDLLISDSVPTAETVDWEISNALASGGGGLIIGNHHWNDRVRIWAAASSCKCVAIRERPRGHPYPGRTVDMAWIRPKASTEVA